MLSFQGLSYLNEFRTGDKKISPWALPLLCYDKEIAAIRLCAWCYTCRTTGIKMLPEVPGIRGIL